MSIVDASVVVAIFKTDDAHHTLARSWYRSALRGDLVVPSILLAEVAGALARPTGDPEEARLAVQSIRNTTGIRVVPVDVALGQAAADIARTQRIRGCDAVYVALAARTGEPLITLDDEQIARGSAVAEVRRPEPPMDDDDDAD
ncbi:MAG: type II toxin-antitoxin system VapC family toxin [Dehalococcoidia bacterium]